MKRRKLLQSIALSAGAMVILPSWAQGWSQERIITTQVFKIEEKEMLRLIAGTFIPEGTSKGANGVGVERFLDKLFSDCYTEGDQHKIKTAIQSLSLQADLNHHLSFGACSAAQREGLLLDLEKSAEHLWAYTTLRAETIRGYTTSEYVLTEHYHYVMAPGFYHGCENV
ncbi:gluconate 2-dehydrogenase subunit 3 family protein [Aquirufa beregesia]|nr:gluconate 2-dehydrogenase subunit 3 family protein [Aquirufa beregesia]